MVKVHINNTKHITMAYVYIPPRDSTSTHYKTADADIWRCMRNITSMSHSVLTGDVGTHSTLWHSCTDDRGGQLMADVISNSDHITQTSSPDITMVSNTLYNRTSWTTQHALSSDHLPIITTITIRHDYRLQPNRRTFTNYKKAYWTQFTEDTESAFAQSTIPTNIHTANIIFTNIILMTDKHNIPKGKMLSNCRLLLEDIVCKVTQINNIRKANTCDPVSNSYMRRLLPTCKNTNETHGRSIYTLTGTTGTTHTFYGRPYMVYPIEHIQPHTTTQPPSRPSPTK